MPINAVVIAAIIVVLAVAASRILRSNHRTRPALSPTAPRGPRRRSF